eukprot:scaffold127197_cov37-Tisochrysis_lutea.AAC.3
MTDAVSLKRRFAKGPRTRADPRSAQATAQQATSQPTSNECRVFNYYGQLLLSTIAPLVPLRPLAMY